MRRTSLAILAIMLIMLTACSTANSPKAVANEPPSVVNSRTFTRNDLTRFVLQPTQTQAQLEQTLSTTDMSTVFSVDLRNYQAYGPQAQEVRKYDFPKGVDSGYIVWSHAVLFRDPHSASQALNYLYITFVPDGCSNRFILKADGLGDESMGFSAGAQNWNYMWRVGNVVMLLEVAGDAESTLHEQDARALAGLVQSNLQ